MINDELNKLGCCIPEESLNVVLLSKSVYRLPSLDVEIQCTSKTLHPFSPRTIHWYDYFSKGFLEASHHLANLEIGRFYSIKGFFDIHKDEECIRETMYCPEFKFLELDKDWSDIVSITIELISEDELYTEVDGWGFDEKKYYSKQEVFWWAKQYLDIYKNWLRKMKIANVDI